MTIDVKKQYTYAVRATDPDSNKAWPRAVLFTGDHVVATDGKRLHIAELALPHAPAKPIALPMEQITKHRKAGHPALIDVVRNSYESEDALDLAACFPPYQQIVRDHERRSRVRTSAVVLDLRRAKELSATLQREVWYKNLEEWQQGLETAKRKDASARRGGKHNEKSYRENYPKPTLTSAKVYMRITASAITIGTAADPHRYTLLSTTEWQSIGWPQNLTATFELRYVVEACAGHDHVTFEVPAPYRSNEQLTDPMCVYGLGTRAYVMPCRL